MSSLSGALETLEKDSELINSYNVLKQEDDSRYGIITICVSQTAFPPMIMQKEKIDFEISEFEKDVFQARERMSLSHPSMLQMIDYSAKSTNDNQFSVTGFYEFVPKSLEQEIAQRMKTKTYFHPQILLQIFGDILSAIGYLQSNRMVHGDIRPLYISLDDKNQASLVDRLGDPSPPNRVQLNSFNSNLPLYMAPALFLAFSTEQYKIKHNPYKSDLFSLGLVMLETGILDSIQKIFNRETKQIDFVLLMSKIKQFVQIYRGETLLEKMLLSMLELEESNRLDPRKLILQLQKSSSPAGEENKDFVNQAKENEEKSAKKIDEKDEESRRGARGGQPFSNAQIRAESARNKGLPPLKAISETSPSKSLTPQKSSSQPTYSGKKVSPLKPIPSPDKTHSPLKYIEIEPVSEPTLTPQEIIKNRIIERLAPHSNLQIIEEDPDSNRVVSTLTSQKLAGEDVRSNDESNNSIQRQGFAFVAANSQNFLACSSDKRKILSTFDSEIERIDEKVRALIRQTSSDRKASPDPNLRGSARDFKQNGQPIHVQYSAEKPLQSRGDLILPTSASQSLSPKFIEKIEDLEVLGQLLISHAPGDEGQLNSSNLAVHFQSELFKETAFHQKHCHAQSPKEDSENQLSQNDEDAENDPNLQGQRIHYGDTESERDIDSHVKPRTPGDPSSTNKKNQSSAKERKSVTPLIDSSDKKVVINESAFENIPRTFAESSVAKQLSFEAVERSVGIFQNNRSSIPQGSDQHEELAIVSEAHRQEELSLIDEVERSDSFERLRAGWNEAVAGQANDCWVSPEKPRKAGRTGRGSEASNGKSVSEAGVSGQYSMTSERSGQKPATAGSQSLGNELPETVVEASELVELSQSPSPAHDCMVPDWNSSIPRFTPAESFFVSQRPPFFDSKPAAQISPRVSAMESSEPLSKDHFDVAALANATMLRRELLATPASEGRFSLPPEAQESQKRDSNDEVAGSQSLIIPIQLDESDLALNAPIDTESEMPLRDQFEPSLASPKPKLTTTSINIIEKLNSPPPKPIPAPERLSRQKFEQLLSPSGGGNIAESLPISPSHLRPPSEPRPQLETRSMTHSAQIQTKPLDSLIEKLSSPEPKLFAPATSAKWQSPRAELHPARSPAGPSSPSSTYAQIIERFTSGSPRPGRSEGICLSSTLIEPKTVASRTIPISGQSTQPPLISLKLDRFAFASQHTSPPSSPPPTIKPSLPVPIDSSFNTAFSQRRMFDAPESVTAPQTSRSPQPNPESDLLAAPYQLQIDPKTKSKRYVLTRPTGSGSPGQSPSQLASPISEFPAWAKPVVEERPTNHNSPAQLPISETLASPLKVHQQPPGAQTLIPFQLMGSPNRTQAPQSLNPGLQYLGSPPQRLPVSSPQPTLFSMTSPGIRSPLPVFNSKAIEEIEKRYGGVEMVMNSPHHKVFKVTEPLQSRPGSPNIVASKSSPGFEQIMRTYTAFRDPKEHQEQFDRL